MSLTGDMWYHCWERPEEYLCRWKDSAKTNWAYVARGTPWLIAFIGAVVILCIASPFTALFWDLPKWLLTERDNC